MRSLLDRRLRRRGSAIGAAAIVLVLAGTSVAIWAVERHGPTQITSEELRGYPQIALVWGKSSHVSSTATGDLYVVGPDGTGLRRLKDWPDRLKDGRAYGTADAHWSPHGKRIALMLGVWYGDPYRVLAIVSSDGRSLHKLRVPADISGAAWSSDWRALLTTYNGDQLWTIGLDKGKAKRIWRAGKNDSVSGGDWSPNGRRLVAAVRRGLVEMAPDGSDVVALTHNGRDTQPHWSPDGRLIAFLRLRACAGEFGCKDPAKVYVVAADGTGVRQLTSASDTSPLIWSPDGSSILVSTASDDGSVTGINLIDTEGRNVRSLTSGRRDYPLAWFPDGSKVLFLRESEGKQSRGEDELWVMDADGRRQTRLPFNRRGSSVLSADWAP